MFGLCLKSTLDKCREELRISRKYSNYIDEELLKQHKNYIEACKEVDALTAYKADNLTLLQRIGVLEGAFASANECANNRGEEITRLYSQGVRYRMDLSKLTEQLKAKKRKARKKKK